MARMVSLRAARLIAQLDRALAKDGQTVLLRRYATAPGGSSVYFQVALRARLLTYQPAELIAGSGLAQGDIRFILSPTRIIATGWPGATNLLPRDKRVPDKDKCKMVVAGLERTMKAARGVYVDDALVRIEGTVSA